MLKGELLMENSHRIDLLAQQLVWAERRDCLLGRLMQETCRANRFRRTYLKIADRSRSAINVE